MPTSMLLAPARAAGVQRHGALDFGGALVCTSGGYAVIEDLRTLPGLLANCRSPARLGRRTIANLARHGCDADGRIAAPAACGSSRAVWVPTGVGDLDTALGRQFAPRRAFVPRARFRARCDFETEIENVAYLEKALEPLIARCAQFLRERQAGVQALRLKLRHRTEPATRVHLGLASVTGERRRLMDVLTQKLGRLELKAPVRGMELISGSLLPLSAASLDVFAGLAGPAAATRHRNWWSVCVPAWARRRCMEWPQSRSIGPKRRGGASMNSHWPRHCAWAGR